MIPSYESKKAIELPCYYEQSIITRLSVLSDAVYENINELENLTKELKTIEGAENKAFFCSEKIVPLMEKIRVFADECEAQMGAEYWPFPTYGELLYGV